jgi:hypothetical protein
MSRHALMTWKALAVLCAVFFSSAAAISACGSDNGDTVSGGGDGGDEGGSGGEGGLSACAAGGSTCAVASDCCSANCDTATKKCVGGLSSSCTAANDACTFATDCCSLSCTGGKCSGTQCTSDNQTCSANDQCCSGECGTNGKCTALNTKCLTAGNVCTSTGAGCCSTLCSGGVCQLSASFCIQAGDVCAKSTNCCTGSCSIASGASLGTCSTLPNLGRNNCSGGVDGTVCGGGTNDGGAGCLDCCSRLCAPYAPTGVFICQPANGCHVEGDLCQHDTDCCGGESVYPDGGEPLPGAQRVQCLLAAGATVGYCASPTSGGPGLPSCNPEGNICHFKDNGYVCGNSAEENNCCDHLGSKTDCELDSIGVPRCHVVGGDAGILPCVPTSGECAFDGDCCGGKCLPNSSGVLVCNAVTCSPSAGTCTTTADCCDGLNCNIAAGSTSGTCGGSTGSPKDGGSGSCAAYGQSCSVASDCCNSVPCYNGICLSPPR